jgi:hypothetical protein
MPSEQVHAIAAAQRGLVIAPAGCGKTHLLAEAALHSTGRQLLLTHTHAGVRAIRNYLEKFRVPSQKVRVATIDGFALRYATSFPTISNWSKAIPKADDWRILRQCAYRVFKHSSPRRVVRATYAGLLVDEYQDCSMGQHELIASLADILPARVVGDPLQAIFAFLDKSNHCAWKDVEAFFPSLFQLSTPHRWKDKNAELGEWLTGVRTKLIEGRLIDLSAGPIKFTLAGTTDNDRHIGMVRTCAGMKKADDESAVALRQHRNQCYKLARYVRGRLRAMETIECEDLLDWSEKIESSTGIDRVERVIRFADTCMSGLPADVKKIPEKLRNAPASKFRRLDYQNVLRSLQLVVKSDDLQAVVSALVAIESLEVRPVIGRKELWRELRSTLREHSVSPQQDIRHTASHRRNRLRYVGKKTDPGCLATPLLVKGLEFDHALLLDTDDHTEAETLYVAMTRGSRSLEIISKAKVVQRNRPLYLQ